MSNTIIQLKANSVSGAIPTADQLTNSEIAINRADGKLYAKAANGSIILLNPSYSSSNDSSSSSNVNIGLIISLGRNQALQ